MGPTATPKTDRVALSLTCAYFIDGDALRRPAFSGLA
jgi:hypothetical protein